MAELTELELGAVSAYKALQSKNEFNYYNMFVAGVEWHKNHVWHTNEERPSNGKEALIEYGNDWHYVGYYYTDSDSFQIGIEDYVERSRVARWAYLEDLVSL